jgi:hypothetical protein
MVHQEPTMRVRPMNKADVRKYLRHCIERYRARLDGTHETELLTRSMRLFCNTPNDSSTSGYIDFIGRRFEAITDELLSADEEEET